MIRLGHSLSKPNKISTLRTLLIIYRVRTQIFQAEQIKKILNFKFTFNLSKIA